VDAVQIAELEAPNYFFLFKEIQSKNEYSAYLIRKNTGTSRYGEFDLILPTDLEMPDGTYRYDIYENDDAVSTDVENMNLLETGLMMILETPASGQVYDAPELTAKIYATS
jgi:hypothetical protein